MNLNDYFGGDNNFRFIEAVRAEKTPWAAIELIPTLIDQFVKDRPSREINPSESDALRIDTLLDKQSAIVETALTVTRTIRLGSSLCYPSLAVFIGAGTTLESTAIIKTPCIIGEKCDIRQGAYLRGSVIVGDSSVIGHATEIKNSIVMDHSAAGHFNYIGDSILGGYVNLGAGTKLANLQFRTKKELRAGTINEIVILHQHKKIATGRGKLGAIVGDFTEIGCNTVTSPGCLIGAGSWVAANITLPKGVFAPGSYIRPGHRDKLKISADFIRNTDES